MASVLERFERNLARFHGKQEPEQRQQQEQAMVPPFIGLIVLYHHNAHSEPQPGMVAAARSPTSVNLALWDAFGRPYADPPTGVRFVGEGEVPPLTGPWCGPIPGMVSEVAEAARKGFGEGKG